jgi:DNA repair exonuclease SbcCD ATPase subunit
MKLTGKNFQPWPEFEVDISGLTILVGPSDKGKSSLYRALRGVLRNDLDANYIRDPKDAPLELTVQHEGHIITATRSKKGSVKYRIDGQDFAKLDGDVPEVVRRLKFGEVRIGDFSFDPIFASQNRPQFLIDNDSFKPSEINAILGAFGGTEKLEAGKKQANLQKSQKDGEARVLAGQIRTAEERKAKLTGLSAAVHAAYDRIAALEGLAALLETEAGWLAETASCQRRLAPLQEILASLAPPDTAEIEPLRQLGASAGQAARASSFARWIDKPLKALGAVLNDWNEAMDSWRLIKALREAAGLLSAMPDTQELAAFQMEISATGLNDLQASITLVEHVIALRKELQETNQKSATVDDQLSAAQSDLSEAQHLEDERNRVEGVCPRCGKTTEHMCG